MTRSTKLITTCTLALAAAGALAIPAVAAAQAPPDRAQTISILDRNATMLPSGDDAASLTAPATAS
ncbi:hypothetical protein [Streptomyces sp. 891-h]|uniref:hypothetical protein n=1 Tax=Streptomyces sp. 891-h TaxID=2720714 RepID=UPI001FAA402D|nr:hypothetical protein [Streptomyces sp. 891-h]UNZ18782.1 hypothetical protein HC362_18800 [Streptomyces sp. 891-h]